MFNKEGEPIDTYQAVELAIGIAGVHIVIANFFQCILDLRDKKRVPGIKRFYHVLLALGGIIIAIGAFIAAFQVHGKLYAGSQSCNEILAYFFTIALLRTLKTQLKILSVFNLDSEKPCINPIIILYPPTVVVVITPILWIFGICWMFLVDGGNKWKVLSYLPNGVCLCMLTTVLIIFATVFLPKKIKQVAAPKRYEAYKKLAIIGVLSALLGAYTLYDTKKVYKNNSDFISVQTRSVSSIQSTLITRIIAFVFLIIFTILMWETKPRPDNHQNSNPRMSNTTQHQKVALTYPEREKLSPKRKPRATLTSDSAIIEAADMSPTGPSPDAFNTISTVAPTAAAFNTMQSIGEHGGDRSEPIELATTPIKEDTNQITIHGELPGATLSHSFENGRSPSSEKQDTE